jgi:hypothetical protein
LKLVATALLALVVLTATTQPLAAPGTLTIAQLQYDGGGDWYANPTGLPNLLRAIGAETGMAVAERPAQVRLTDARLWSYPYIYITGHGEIRLSEEEVRTLRRYLLSGGFLHADDNYGMDESFRREIRRVFPDKDLVEVPLDHPIYRIRHPFPQGLPKVHEHEGETPQGFGIFHEGRLIVYYTYETDLGNGWEDADVHNVAPEVRQAALRMGVNIFLYALSQVAP